MAFRFEKTMVWVISAASGGLSAEFPAFPSQIAWEFENMRIMRILEP